MSAGIMPDMYRHTARKSTVSKNVKPSNISICNNNNSTTNYATYNNEKNSNESTIFDTLECNIKLEKDIPQQDETFLILPDNEMEEMIIGEEIEGTNEDIIYDIIEQIIQQIIQPSSPLTSNQITRTVSINTQDAHHAVGSMMNQFNEIDRQEVSSNNIEENENTSSDEMESDQPTSTASRSQTDDDIVEIDGTSNINSPHLCTCQCHKPNSPLNNEYLLFEEALKQTRLEQQQEKSLTNNHLIQMLKRQHDELMNVYQQNQKQTTKTKIDREQQTIKLHLHDSQMQTDMTTNHNSKISSQPKSMVSPTLNSHNNGPLTATRNYPIFSNSNSTSSNSSLQQMIPRLSTNTVATTIVTNKTTTTTTKTAIVTNSQAAILSPSTSSTATSHDIVDLTEEDEDDNSSRVSSTQRTAPLRQSTSSIPPPTPSSSSTTAPAATATRIRATNRAIRPNNPVTNGQAFPLRPLPEHIPCDHTIARPQLSITQENATVRLTWNLQLTPMESIQNYEIYAYKQNATATASDWKKIGSVKSMRLPMAVTLKEFQSNSHYAFAVRAVSINNHIGPFCEPKTIFTGSTSIQPLHTSQLLNVSS